MGGLFSFLSLQHAFSSTLRSAFVFVMYSVQCFRNPLKPDMYTKPRLKEWGVKFTISTGVPDSLPAVGLPRLQV